MRRAALVHLALLLCLRSSYVQADGNDWINPKFVLRKSGAPKAMQTITTYAKNMAKEGPWTVFGNAKVLPPNGDKLDYLSWAPYHWPDCNWCSGARQQFAEGGNRTRTDGSPGPSPGSNQTNDNDSYDDGDDGSDTNARGSDPGDGSTSDDWESDGDDELDGVMALSDASFGGSADTSVLTSTASLPIDHRRMLKRFHNMLHSRPSRREADNVDDPQAVLEDLPNPTVPEYVLSTALPDGDASTTTQNVMSGTEGAAENARKTTNTAPKAKATQASGKGMPKPTQNGASCTPSPTRSLSPSATWTTCKYVVRDGKMNPDVRTLPGVSMFADAAQGIIYNTLASVFTGSEEYAQNAVKFISTFFLDSKTGMHPRILYGQVIRGPGKQEGQYLGVLDLRGMVKVANAIQILRASQTSAWTAALDKSMTTWATQYVAWLHSSSQGQKALSAPNNHGSFAANQLAAIAIVDGSTTDAKDALQSYFNGQFKDQIAASGEQPYEAVRTRPFHYRCFNLEAMITNAKLGDQVGVNYWTAKSKYGATIQNALDFVMSKGPGKEEISDIFPLVAAVAAAYGDPSGKYDSYLRRNDKKYEMAPYYYYDQSAALTRAPTSSKSAKRDGDMSDKSPSGSDFDVPTPTESTIATPTIPFACPAAFATQTLVELDDGIYATCDELKPFYGYADQIKESI